MRFFFVFLTLLLASTLLPLAVLADEGDIRVVEATAESQFPDGIRFFITAESSGQIDEIRVFFRKADETGRSAYRSIDVEPGVAVSGESILPAGTGGDYFPPGTKINYSFEVRDKAGAMVRTEDQEFIYLDNRFEWGTVTDGLITVYYYGEYVEERANVVLEAAQEAMERMLPVLGITPEEPLRIVSYNNYRHMASALPFRSQAVREGLQTQGMAFSAERVLLVHGFDPTVTGTTSHEFVHLLVAEAAGGSSTMVPAWLNEGLAEYGNIDPTDDYDAALRYGVFTRRLKPLWYQSAFGGEPEDILIAYGQGRSVVRYMLREYGTEKMAELFKSLRDTQNIDLSLKAVYGIDQYGLDTAWRLALGLEPLPSPEELEARLNEPASQEETGEETGDVTGEEPAVGEGGGDEPASDEATAEEGGGDETTSSPAPAGENGSDPDVDETSADTPEAGASPEETGEASSGGCSALTGAPASASLGMLALLGAPLGLLAWPALRRRRPEAEAGPEASGPGD